MFRFEDLFDVSAIRPSDATSLGYIFANVVEPITAAVKAEFEDFSPPENKQMELYRKLGNTLLNDVMAHFASNEVLFAIDGMLVEFDIPESVRGKFRSYYQSLVKGNADSLLPPDMPFLLNLEIFPVPAELLAKTLFEFFQHFAEVRKLVFMDTLKLMDKVANETADKATKAMSEIYLFTKNKPDVGFDELSDYCKAAFERNGSPDMYNSFSVVIGLFADFPFKHTIFRKFVYEKLHDTAIDDLELQRKYLMTTLRKDSKYDTNRKYINKMIDSYRSKME